jgi:hypothetical protein
VHHDSSPALEPLPGANLSTTSWPQDDLSGRIARVPRNYDQPFDLVMRAGEMSIHHPVTLHGSNPNVSDEPRIGLSASYTIPELYKNPKAVVWVHGDGPRRHDHFQIDRPPDASFEEAIAAYCAGDYQPLYAPV